MSTLDHISPRRVLMTADPIGGVWTYAMELCGALGEQGIEIGLATLGARLTPAQKSEVRTHPNVTLFESGYKLEWMEEPRADIERAGNWLLTLEQDFRPDVIHLNSFSHGAFPWRNPKLVVGHSCVLSWWQGVHGCDAPAVWDEYREMVMAGLHGADLVAAPSHAMLAALKNNYGPFAASTVIYNGRRLAARPRSKHDFILTAGRLWDDAKNISLLARVAPQLPWPVYVAGDENDPEGRGIKPSGVHRLGQLSSNELLPWFERASIYALPARYEPFGLSALEAALCGCALVLGDIPSLREIWGDAALFVSPDDTAGLEQTLKRLIAHPEEIAALGAKARDVARQYTPERMAASCLAAYASLLSRRETHSHAAAPLPRSSSTPLPSETPVATAAPAVRPPLRPSM